MRRKRAALASHSRSLIRRSRTKSKAGAENAATKNETPAIGQKCCAETHPERSDESDRLAGSVGAALREVAHEHRDGEQSETGESEQDAPGGSQPVRRSGGAAVRFRRRANRRAHRDPCRRRGWKGSTLRQAEPCRARRSQRRQHARPTERCDVDGGGRDKCGEQAPERHEAEREEQSGLFRPCRSATIENPTTESDTARTMANTTLMLPSVSPKESLA